MCQWFVVTAHGLKLGAFSVSTLKYLVASNKSYRVDEKGTDLALQKFQNSSIQKQLFSFLYTGLHANYFKTTALAWATLASLSEPA